VEHEDILKNFSAVNAKVQSVSVMKKNHHTLNDFCCDILSNTLKVIG